MIRRPRRPPPFPSTPLSDPLPGVRGGASRPRLAKTGDPLMDEIATVFNGMADQLDLFTSEVNRSSWSAIPLKTVAISSISGSPVLARRGLEAPPRTPGRGSESGVEGKGGGLRGRRII